MIKLIFAQDKNGLIGNGDKLPWNIPNELNFFKETTLNKNILMGDVTFDGIGRVLPNRKTTILTLDKNYSFVHDDVSIEHNINNIVDKYYQSNEDDIYICGGATIYKLFLPFADELIISKIKNEYSGDVFFPKYNKNIFDLTNIKEYKEFNVEFYKRINI